MKLAAGGRRSNESVVDKSEDQTYRCSAGASARGGQGPVRFIDGAAYEVVPILWTGNSATTMTELIEREFIFQPPFLEAVDADFKMRELMPRVSIRDGWRFIY